MSSSPLPTPIRLPGSVISLDPLDPRHATGLYQSATPDLFTHLLQKPIDFSLPGFQALVERLLSQPRVSWVITLNSTGQTIGHTSYLNIKPEHKTLEIGTTWIAAKHQATAVNPESKLLLLNHAFDSLGYNRVEFLVSIKNLRSQAAVAKLGATKEGILRSRWLTPDGSTRDVVVFSIIREEWPAIRDPLKARVASASP